MKKYLFALLILAHGCASASTLDTAAQKQSVLEGLRPAVRLDGHEPIRWALKDRLAQMNTPAIAIAVVDDFRIAWVHTEGLAEANTTRAVTSETRFHAKSISKPVTAFATLLMMERFNLDLEVDISHYLRSWSVPENEFTAGQIITKAQILSHSAGFTRWGVDSYEVGEELPTLLESLNGVPPAKFSPVTVDYVPGTDSRYSGGGYGVLQQMLLDISYIGFGDLIRYLVLGPMDMEHSDFPQPMRADWSEVGASGHNRSGEVIEGKWETLPIMAAGGLWTTADDLARFVIEVMDAWNGKSELMSKSTARVMLTRRTDTRSLGFDIAHEDGVLEFSHTGSGDGFKALILGQPGSGKGLVILTNGDASGGLRDEIRRSVSEEYGWANRELEVTRRAMPLSAGSAAHYVGTYEFDGGEKWEVGLNGKRVMIDERDWNGWVDIYPESATRFFSLSNYDYVFNITTDGAVDELSVTYGVTEYVARKID